MDCPECHFSPYVPGKPHWYGGRESSKLQCYGPKVRRAVPPKRGSVDEQSTCDHEFADSKSCIKILPSGKICGWIPPPPVPTLTPAEKIESLAIAIDQGGTCPICGKSLLDKPAFRFGDHVFCSRKCARPPKREKAPKLTKAQKALETLKLKFGLRPASSLPPVSAKPADPATSRTVPRARRRRR